MAIAKLCEQPITEGQGTQTTLKLAIEASGKSNLAGNLEVLGRGEGWGEVKLDRGDRVESGSKINLYLAISPPLLSVSHCT